jgi:hypothetical protein
MAVKYWTLLAVLAALATPAAAGDLPRLAQSVEMVPPYEVLAIVRSAGLDPVGRPMRRGPTYVLRAIDDDDREVRVVIDARYGEIMSITPVMTASRDLPLRELPPRRTMGPYERAPDGYGRPGYRSAPPPIIYESDPPLERPRAGLPDDPRHAGQALPPPARGGPPPVIYSDRSPDEIESRPLSRPRPVAPQASIETDHAPGADGLLPPPPERFPQRAPPPAAKPAPPKRAAAAPPKQAPLPKPRPPAAATVDAEPPPQPQPKSAVDEMPN